MQHNSITSELEHHHKDCYGWALHCCYKDRELAQEVLQVSYLKMLERQNAFRSMSAFKTWAFTVIKNTAIDALRKRKKESKLIRNDNELPDDGYDGGFEKESEQKITRVLFMEALSRLSDRQREVLQLVFYHDLSLNQAAEVLKISQGSVRKHYDRAKKTLAEWFQKNEITAT
jgi:RNA polymerase sigma-70 factor (ECF subfamily)